MRGNGTGLGSIPNNPPPARLLDITRLARRAGRTPTGIDRVELAYLRALSDRPDPLWTILRSSLGYLLLNAEGSRAALRLFEQGGWGAADWLSRLRGLEPVRARAEASLRRLACARCAPPGLARMLRRHLPTGIAYLNTGHSNLTARMIAALRRVPGARLAVLVHDTIPLDHPDTQRPETARAFAAFLARTARHADLVIATARATRVDITRHLAAAGRVPPLVVAPLGVTPPRPDPAALPAGLPPAGPYFVALGTIEPRKNHALLLDLWEDLARDGVRPLPALVLCGARGWRNEAFLARLDASPLLGSTILEAPGLSDGAVGALLHGARALLFPSRAEGYGLPPLEAAALGVPVLCSDLPVLRELLGDIPVYLPATESYPWRKKITSLAASRAEVSKEEGQSRTFAAPGWQAHFKTVLSVT